MQFQECLPEKVEGSKEVYVISNLDQNKTEELALTLMYGLSLLNPSPRCLEMAEPFLCLYLFPLCNITNGTTNATANTIYRPTRDECVVLTQDVCQSEWEIAKQRFSEILPECSDFEDAPPLCTIS